MVGNAAPPPSNEPVEPATWWDAIKAVLALVGLVIGLGVAALGFLIYMVTDGSFFN